MGTLYRFAAEYRSEELSDNKWIFNVFPIFLNYKYNDYLPVSVNNPLFSAYPVLNQSSFAAAALAPLDKRIPLITDNLSLPEDIDTTTESFLDMDAEFFGVLYPRDLKDYQKKMSMIVTHGVFITKDAKKKYKEDGTIPDIAFESSTMLSNDFVYEEVDWPLEKIAYPLKDLSENVYESMTDGFVDVVDNPFSDVRLLYSVKEV